MRVMMLPKGAVQASDPTYAPLGAPGISLENPPGSGALALKLALKVLKGEKVPKLTLMPPISVTSDNVKLCKEGSWQEMKDGCNVFDPALVPPGWFANIYNPDTPELGLKAALVGEPEPRKTN
jgi:ribose transport system substrate-binding protein